VVPDCGWPAEELRSKGENVDVALSNDGILGEDTMMTHGNIGANVILSRVDAQT